MTTQTQQKININSVPAGSVVLIQGDLTYSRLASFIEGDELRRKNNERQQRGLHTINSPYTTVSIKNAQIVPQSKDLNNLTVGEQYIQQKFYRSKKHPDTGWNYTIDNKGKFLPALAKRNETGDGFVQFYPTSDFATNQHVYIQLRFFGSNRPGYNNGCGINTVLVDTQTPSYLNDNTGAALVESLALYGINFTTSPNPANEAPMPVDNTVDILPEVVQQTPAQPVYVANTQLAQPQPQNGIRYDNDIYNDIPF